MASRRNRAARAADAAQPQPATGAEVVTEPDAVATAPEADSLDASDPSEDMRPAPAEGPAEPAPVEPVYQPTDDDRFAADAMRMHYQEGVPREEVDRWYAEKMATIGVAWKPSPDEAASPGSPRLTHGARREQPAASPYLLRRRLVGNVTGHGFTVDGVARDHWWVGEVGDFKPAVVESAASCFEPVYL